jgi:hypothetical protein
MIPGECVNDTVTICNECKSKLKIGVFRSPAGYYIGFHCPCCGPYSRESGYYKQEAEANDALAKGWYGR